MRELTFKTVDGRRMAETTARGPRSSTRRGEQGCGVLEGGALCGALGLVATIEIEDVVQAVLETMWQAEYTPIEAV